MSEKISKLAVKVIPNASRNEMVGWLGASLKIKVSVPPLDGRANEVLCEFVAGVLGLPRRSVRVERGEKSRQKLLLIEGFSDVELQARLEQVCR